MTFSIQQASILRPWSPAALVSEISAALVPDNFCVRADAVTLDDHHANLVAAAKRRQRQKPPPAMLDDAAAPSPASGTPTSGATSCHPASSAAGASLCAPFEDRTCATSQASDALLPLSPASRLDVASDPWNSCHSGCGSPAASRATPHGHRGTCPPPSSGPPCEGTPGAAAPPEVLQPPRECPAYVLVVIDGTWQQGREMFKVRLPWHCTHALQACAPAHTQRARCLGFSFTLRTIQRREHRHPELASVLLIIQVLVWKNRIMSKCPTVHYFHGTLSVCLFICVLVDSLWKGCALCTHTTMIASRQGIRNCVFSGQLHTRWKSVEMLYYGCSGCTGGWCHLRVQLCWCS